MKKEAGFVAFSVPGEPVAFARARLNGKRHFTPSAQRAYMGSVGLFAARAMAGADPFEGPLEVQVRAVYSHPASWSEKKKASVRWRVSKPDCDNVGKLVLDAMNSIVFRDDAQVADLRIQKAYGSFSGLWVSVQQLKEART